LTISERVPDAFEEEAGMKKWVARIEGKVRKKNHLKLKESFLRSLKFCFLSVVEMLRSYLDNMAHGIHFEEWTQPFLQS